MSGVKSQVKTGAAAQGSQLIAAMAKAQGEFQPIEKNAKGYSHNGEPFSYADLAEITAKTRPALSKYGLVVMQPIIQEGAGAVLLTILAHESGEQIESRINLNSSASIQDFGTAISYLRRYAKSAILDVAADADADELGERLIAAQQGGSGSQYESDYFATDSYQQEDPAYPPEEFEQDFPEWEGLIKSGTIKAQDVVNIAKKRFPLSESQEAQILAVEVNV